MAQMKRICHYATETGVGIVVHGHYPKVTVTTGIAVETTLQKKKNLWCVKMLSHVVYVFPLTTGTWDGSKSPFFLLDQQVTKPTCLVLHPCVFRVLWSDLES